MEIKRKNELFEMEKLRFEFKKAKESEQRAYEALARSQSHSAHPRDKKPSPRVEVHRESGGSRYLETESRVYFRGFDTVRYNSIKFS